MAKLKTTKTSASVAAFVSQIKSEDTRSDCQTIIQLMQQATRAKPKMWGSSIIGFGSRRLKYESGREIDWMVMGFSPRKAGLSLYLTCSLEHYAPLLKKLGKHKTGVGCLYIKKLADVDMKVLKEMIGNAAKSEKKKHS